MQGVRLGDEGCPPGTTTRLAPALDTLAASLETPEGSPGLDVHIPVYLLLLRLLIRRQQRPQILGLIGRRFVNCDTLQLLEDKELRFGWPPPAVLDSRHFRSSPVSKSSIQGAVGSGSPPNADFVPVAVSLGVRLRDAGRIWQAGAGTGRHGGLPPAYQRHGPHNSGNTFLAKQARQRCPSAHSGPDCALRQGVLRPHRHGASL
jgi:hypothetical protein